MREVEILATTEEEAKKKAAESEGVTVDDLEIKEEFEPDEQDLKDYQEAEKLPEPPSADSITLYVVQIKFDYYVRRAQEWTQGLIERFAPESRAEAIRFRNTIIVRLLVPETSILIGKKGATLDALQHVVIRALLVEDENFPDVMLDVEGYREKKLQRLEREGRRAAEKALRSGRKVPLAPMNPGERKFVHKVLQDFGGVKTESRGSDRSRHIVVEPIDAKPRSGNRDQGNRGRGGNSGGDPGRGGNRSGGGGNRSSANKGGKRPHEISDDQRSLLYGDLRGEERTDDDLRAAGSLLPAFNLDDDDDDDFPANTDDKLVDEIE